MSSIHYHVMALELIEVLTQLHRYLLCIFVTRASIIGNIVPVCAIYAAIVYHASSCRTFYAPRSQRLPIYHCESPHERSQTHRSQVLKRLLRLWNRLSVSGGHVARFELGLRALSAKKDNDGRALERLWDDNMKFSSKARLARQVNLTRRQR